jgi:sterol desaturase/sphingolipid hydroxylase (fatty acid hydroxylase superfamily)
MPSLAADANNATPVKGAVARVASYIYYPVVMAIGLTALWAAWAGGLPVSVGPYLAVLVTGALVLLGETVAPYRGSWRPGRGALLGDAAFMAFVQVLLPLGLGWLAVWLVQLAASRLDLTLEVWPSHWPLWAQVLLKIAIGDFLRYWLHRWSHEAGWLWRWHAPHHQPEKLYAANVFRFHPADKALQFLADTLPFIILGMGTQALGYYFVVYATSGFFQHSNCDIRLGPFNYLISGPEVHRWHHSRTQLESNGNYGHTLVLWDLLFGTYRRLKGREVAELGLMDPTYPKTFVGQLLAPFRRTGSGE